MTSKVVEKKPEWMDRLRLVSASRVERWLGPWAVNALIEGSKGLRKPVFIGNTGGPIFTYDGEIWGTMRGGAIASLDDLIAEITAGKKQILNFTKAGATGVVGRSNTLWTQGTWPPAGAAGGTTGTGAARTKTTSGAMRQQNAASGDQLYVLSGISTPSVGTNLLMMYDRLWDMTHTMTVDPRSCDAANPPTRYQTAATAPGNFITGEVTTVLPAATPTVTFDYVDQDGNNVTGPALSTIASAAAVGTVPFTAPNWFYPLDAADVGVRSLQNSANAVNLSAAMASGVVNWVIGHPLLWIPQGIASIPFVIGGIGLDQVISLERVYDDACLAFLEIQKGATTATNYNGQVVLVSG